MHRLNTSPVLHQAKRKNTLAHIAANVFITLFVGPYLLPNCSGATITLTRNIFVLGLIEGGGSQAITFTLHNPMTPTGVLMNVQTSVATPVLLAGDGDDPVVAFAIGQDNCNGTNLADGASCTFDVSFDPGELDPEAKGRDSNLWRFTVSASYTV